MPSALSSAAQRRVRELAAIHAERRRLGLDEATYRDLVSQASGGATASAGALSAEGRGRLLDLLRRTFGTHDGRALAGHAERGRQRAADVAPQLAALRGLWAEGAATGAVRDGSEAALRRLVQRVTGVRALEWLGVAQASDAIEAVKAIVARGPRQAAR